MRNGQINVSIVLRVLHHEKVLFMIDSEDLKDRGEAVILQRFIHYLIVV